MQNTKNNKFYSISTSAQNKSINIAEYNVTTNVFIEHVSPHKCTLDTEVTFHP